MQWNALICSVFYTGLRGFATKLWVRVDSVPQTIWIAELAVNFITLPASLPHNALHSITSLGRGLFST
jgi:hypothetical protein